MQERLFKNMLACSIVFFLASMGVMLYFSATKTIVIAQEASAEKSASPQADLQEQELQFQTDGSGKEMKIPLPTEIRADDMVIENRYTEHSIDIVLNGKYKSFYQEQVLYRNDSRILAGYLSEGNGKTRLRLWLDDLYEHAYIFENGVLELSFEKPRQRYDKILVLDADGSDVPGDHLEKEITLDITEQVRMLLEDTDIHVYCTRTADGGMSKEERTEFALELSADLLVSVRTGADVSSPKVYGIQTFYNDTYFIPYFGNLELADLLERSVVTAVGGKANGLFAAGAEDSLLQRAQIPAAAIEVGYLTNQQEAELLAQELYRRQVAEGIADAVKAAFAEKEQAH